MVIHVGVAHAFVNDEFPIDTREHEACAEPLEIWHVYVCIGYHAQYPSNFEPESGVYERSSNQLRHYKEENAGR